MDISNIILYICTTKNNNTMENLQSSENQSLNVIETLALMADLLNAILKQCDTNPTAVLSIVKGFAEVKRNH